MAMPMTIRSTRTNRWFIEASNITNVAAIVQMNLVRRQVRREQLRDDREAVGENQDAHDHEENPRHDLDGVVMLAYARRRGEELVDRERRGDERHAEPRRIH